MQIDRNVRVFGKKLRQQRRHRPEAEGHRHGKTHEPARGRRLGMGLALRGLALGKNARGTIQQELPRVGQRHAARGAIEQPRAEPLLEPGDSLRYRGLGKLEILGGSRKGTEFGHFGEDR